MAGNLQRSEAWIPPWVSPHTPLFPLSRTHFRPPLSSCRGGQKLQGSGRGWSRLALQGVLGTQPLPGNSLRGLLGLGPAPLEFPWPLPRRVETAGSRSDCYYPVATVAHTPCWRSPAPHSQAVGGPPAPTCQILSSKALPRGVSECVCLSLGTHVKSTCVAVCAALGGRAPGFIRLLSWKPPAGQALGGAMLRTPVAHRPAISQGEGLGQNGGGKAGWGSFLQKEEEADTGLGAYRALSLHRGACLPPGPLQSPPPGSPPPSSPAPPIPRLPQPELRFQTVNQITSLPLPSFPPDAGGKPSSVLSRAWPAIWGWGVTEGRAGWGGARRPSASSSPHPLATQVPATLASSLLPGC